MLKKLAKEYAKNNKVSINKFYSSNGFRSTTNLRKETIDDYKYILELNVNQKIINNYKGFTYYIYWQINNGIISYIFDENGKFLAYSAYTNYPKEALERNTIVYINRIIKILKQYEKSNYITRNPRIR